MRVECKWVGRMPYKECWEYQQKLFNELLAKQGDGSGFAGTIIFVEHPAVYTLGKSGKMSNMLINEERLKALGAEFYHIDRGGDITFHGEGQVVCYPILDLEKLGISRVFSNTTVQKHQFFSAQLSSQSNSHIHT